MPTTAFPVNPTLTAIAIGYRNRDVDLVADLVMPRVVRTGKRFSYTVYTPADGYTIPPTRVGRKSEPTMVDFGGTRVEAECVDWGLDDLVPNEEIEAFEAAPRAAGAVGPLEKSTSMLAGLVALDRELRVAGLVFAAANYAAGHTATLSGTSQWSGFTNSNPLDALLAALDVPLFRPNMVVLGHQVWTRLRRQGVFAPDDFARLADQLAGLRGRFLLSLNDAPEVRRIFAAFAQEAVRVPCSVGLAPTGKQFGELIISGARGSAQRGARTPRGLPQRFRKAVPDVPKMPGTLQRHGLRHTRTPRHASPGQGG